MWAEPPFVLGGGWVVRCSPGHACLGRRLLWPRRMVWQHADSDAAAGDCRRSRRGVAGQVTMTVTAPVPLATLEATLERVTYANEDNGYTVAKVDPGRGGDLVTVVGSLLGAQRGEALRLRGRWSAHPQYGRQFHVEDYTTVLPATGDGLPAGHPVRGHLRWALLPARAGADQRGGEDPPGGHRVGDRLPGRPGHRRRGGPGAAPRPGGRGIGGGGVLGALPPRRDLPVRAAGDARPDRRGPAADLRRGRLGSGAGLAAQAHRRFLL